MNFGGYFSGYTTRKPPPQLRVWANNHGHKAAMFLVDNSTPEEAIMAVKAEGFQRALIEVK